MNHEANNTKGDVGSKTTYQRRGQKPGVKTQDKKAPQHFAERL
jgi:hypothetical protein